MSRSIVGEWFIASILTSSAGGCGRGRDVPLLGLVAFGLAY